MNPPDPKPSGLPKPSQNDASVRRPDTALGGAPRPEVGANGLEKPKPEKLGDRIYKIYLAKTTAEALKLRNLNLPESALQRATKTLALKKTKKRLGEALRYAENSAKAEIITEAEILTEALPEIGITTMKLCPKKPKKKGSKGQKKGGNHGA